MKMIFRLFLFINLFSATSVLAASGSQFGLNVAIGVPFVSQAGLNYSLSDKLGVDLDYGNLTLTADSAKVSLSMPSVILRWHPFAGAFFIGGGLGQESLVSSATSGSQSAEIKITAMTSVAKLGWMWGSGDGGFWFGLDATMVSPSSAKTTITSSLPASDAAYQDAVEQGDKFGKTSYTNITFARFGYIF